MISTRLLTLDDVPEMTRLLAENREFNAPWEPIRPDDYFTEDWQQTLTGKLLGQYADGITVPHVILDEDGRIIGRITLNEIVRGPLQSCSLGYWVDSSHNGRGVATAAAREFVRMAFEDLDLHRIQAGTLVHNVRSQRVLEKVGFVRYGLAPTYLRIAGEWQDHILFQVINPAA